MKGTDSIAVPGVLFQPPGSDTLTNPYSADLPDGTNQYRVHLFCGGLVGNPSTEDCFPAADAPLEVRGVEVVLGEDAPPFGSVLGGTIIAAEPLSDVRSLRYSASDEESGLRRVEALIDGVGVAVQDLGERCSYANFTACPTADHGDLAVDTRQVENGSHSLALRVFDAAGNEKVVQHGAIEIRNSPVPLPGSSIAATSSTVRVRLSARFVGASRSSLTVPFGRRVMVRGRLSTVARLGLRHARIEVLERLDRPGAREVAVGSVQTRADGRFSYTLARGRPISSAADGRQGRPAAGARARIFLGGVRKARTDRRGRFVGTYRLPVRRPGVRLQIRVLVPAERSYPYLSYRGAPVTVQVR